MILKGIEGILIECNFIKRDFVERRNFAERKLRQARDIGLSDHDPQGNRRDVINTQGVNDKFR